MKKLVFDVGATAIKYALMDDDAHIYEKGQRETPKDCLESFLTVLKSIYDHYENEIDGIAMSLPGTIDSKTGQIYAPGGIAYNANVNIVNKMHEFTKLPIAIENDGKCAALAELWKGNLKDCDDGLVIVIGTGIGGGIIKDRQLWKGQHLFAGEFSYVFQSDTGDMMKDAWAVRGSTTALIMEVAKRKHLDPLDLNGKKIFEMIEQGDQDVKDALQTIARSLAIGIYNLQCILDLSKVLIGGGISQQPLVLKYIQKELDDIYHHLPFPIPQAVVETCCFYNDSNLIGALYCLLEHHHA